MPADDQQENVRRSPQPGDFRVPPRTWIVWISVFGGVILLMLARERMDRPRELLSQHAFQHLVDASLIARATINYNHQNVELTEIEGAYYKTDAAGNRLKKNGEDETLPFRAKVRLSAALERELLAMPQIEVREPNTMLMSVVWSVLPIIVIAALIWFFFIRQIKKASGYSERVKDQQSRYDRILDKWEQQAERMEAVLRRMEREPHGDK